MTFKTRARAIWGIFLIQLVSFTNSKDHYQNCVDPTNLAQRLHKINRGLNMERLLLTCLSNHAETNLRRIQTFTKELEISKACPNTTVKGNYPLMARSSCPWFLETDRNTNRYPVEIVYANTRCKHGCIGSDGHMTCERIQLPVYVLKRVGCRKGVNHYQEERILLPIAYTCAEPREKERSESVDISTIEIPHHI